MKLKLLLGLVALLFALPAAHAASGCSLTINAQTYSGFLQEIPALNNQLSSCPVDIGLPTSLLVGTDIVQLNAGQNFYAQIQSDELRSFTQGSTTASFTATTNSCVMDAIFGSNNYMGVAAHAYLEGELTLSANGFWNSLQLAVVRPFLWLGFRQIRVATPLTCSNNNNNNNNNNQGGNTNPPPTFGGGIPDNCDETFLPGHPGYAQNQATWDSYSANTDGVCQTRYGTGTPQGNCAHTVQLSVSGNPYYLCWYNN